MKDVKKPIKRLKPRKENDGGKEENKVKALVTSKIVEIDDLADLAPKRMFQAPCRQRQILLHPMQKGSAGLFRILLQCEAK